MPCKLMDWLLNEKGRSLRVKAHDGRMWLKVSNVFLWALGGDAAAGGLAKGEYHLIKKSSLNHSEGRSTRILWGREYAMRTEVQNLLSLIKLIQGIGKRPGRTRKRGKETQAF